jgi:uncharacterized protein (TIGR00369 family)
MVCGADASQGLNLRFKREADGEVRALVQSDRRHQGYAGIVHGGHLATLLDAAMTHCLFSQGIEAVTGDLEIRYLKPVPLGATMELRARLLAEEHQLLRMQAELWVDGNKKVRAKARFVRLAAT